MDDNDGGLRILLANNLIDEQLRDKIFNGIVSRNPIKVHIYNEGNSASIYGRKGGKKSRSRNRKKRGSVGITNLENPLYRITLQSMISPKAIGGYKTKNVVKPSPKKLKNIKKYKMKNKKQTNYFQQNIINYFYIIFTI